MGMTAKDIMTDHVIVVEDDLPVTKLTELFDEHNITAVPVVRGDWKLVGIVTKTDFLGHFIDLNIELDLKHQLIDLIELADGQAIEDLVTDPDVPVSEIMTENPIIAQENTPIEEIANIMIQKRIHKIIILRDEEIVGIISPIDFLYYVAGVEKNA